MPVPSTSKRFGIAVRMRRTKANISQERLAELAGLPPTYIGMIERGIRNPTLDVAARIAKALKVGFAKLIAETQAPRGGKARKDSPKGKNERAILERGVNIRVRAAVLWRADGRCQMCGRTIAQNNIVLVVDYKIPVGRGGTNEEGNLWAVCEMCRIEARRSSHLAFLLRKQVAAQEKIKVALLYRYGSWTPATWLKAIAGISDWSRSARRLRSEGFNVEVRKRVSNASVLTYYRLFRGI